MKIMKTKKLFGRNYEVGLNLNDDLLFFLLTYFIVYIYILLSLSLQRIEVYPKISIKTKEIVEANWKFLL